MKTFEEVLRSYGLIEDDGMVCCHYSHLLGPAEECVQPLMDALESMINHAKSLEAKVEEMNRDEYIKREFQIRFYCK